MAKKKVLTVVKIQIEAGKASPAPPVGTALGPHGIAIMDFVKAYNAQTEAQAGTVVPTEITIYEDRTFDFVLKTPPTAVLIREKAGLDKAANNPGAEVAGSITEAQLEEIAATVARTLEEGYKTRVAVVDFTDLVVDAGVVEDPLGGRRLARVDVGHDPDVPDLLEVDAACHDFVVLLNYQR